MHLLRPGFHPLIDTPMSSKNFRRHCRKLHKWIRGQIDLCGGWTQSIEDMYAPRAYGVYVFSPDLTQELRDIAQKLGALYMRIGRHMQQSFGNGALLWDRWRIDYFDRPKRALFERLLAAYTPWATTLRADFVLEGGQRPCIIEVNTDNVAGLEDLFIFLHYHRKQLPESNEYRIAIDTMLDGLCQCVKKWIERQYTAFRQALADSLSFPEQWRDAAIAVVYEDRNDSFFLARYLCALLTDVLGVSARACRPEHLVWDQTRGHLQVETPITGELTQVHIVFRHWLFFEMFTNHHDKWSGSPDKKFNAVLEAAARQKALILNPFTDRLLFTKAILSELYRGAQGEKIFDWSPSGQGFILSPQEVAFIKQYIAPAEPASELDHYVYKPSSEFGGKDVLIGGGERVWVKQRKVEPERVRTYYRHKPLGLYSDAIREENLFVVHGLLAYGSTEHGHELAGSYTRIGPDPVVNFSRGGQVVPGILQ